MRTIFGYGLLVFAIIVAVWRQQTPAPLPATAPASEFSATRALVDIKRLAARPHPLGTAEHAAVRDDIVGRLRGMGLKVDIHHDRAVATWGNSVVVAPVDNIVGILPGKDSRKPAVVVMSHYDTVPNSPGAADDTAGVAAMLEIARALKAGATLDRDVIFLITDGEELGLLGATAFFDNDPLAKRIGAAINFEARGDAGLVSMFETGALNAETVAAYAAGAERPNADSLSRAIYKRMPNGTDFTLAARRGLPGLNFAFIGDEAAYHSPLATPEHLDLGSVQHMGDQALPAVRAFAAALPQQSADSVYSDVFGFFVIQYPFAVGWILLVLGAGLTAYALLRAERVTALSWGRGAAGAVLALLVPALLLWAAGRSFAGVDHFQRLAHFDALEIGAALLAIGATALVVAAVEEGRGRLTLIIAAASVALLSCLPGLDPVALGMAGVIAVLAWFGVRPGERPAAVWRCVLIVLLLFSTVAQIFAPEAAFVLVWPLLAAAIVAATRLSLWRGHPGGVVLAVIAALLVVAQGAGSAIGLFTAVGVDMPIILVLPLFAVLPALLLLPGTRRLPHGAHGLVILAGAVLFAFGRFAPPTPTHPVPSVVRHVQDLDGGKAYRVASFSRLDAWSKAALGAPRLEPLPWSDGRKLWWSPVKPASVPPSALAVRRDGAHLVVTANPSPGAFAMVLSVRTTLPRTLRTSDGVKLLALTPGVWSDVRFFAPQGTVLFLDGRGPVAFKLVTTYLDWPKDASKLPAKPDGVMAFGTSGGTDSVLRRSWKP